MLLDIVMPEMDGYEVLATIKADPKLRYIPIVVISTLEDMDAVVKAIELGAEDHLPKTYDPILLKARIGACLEKKQFRDQELEYFSRVNALTDAAEKVESGRFDAESLMLDELAKFKDPIGRLAAIFKGMASEIYYRELKLTRRVHALQGILLVIVNGLIWGLIPALSRLSSGIGSNPIGLAVWVNAVAAVFCLSVALVRGKLPKLSRLSKHDLLFFVAWAFLAGVLQRVTIFVLAEHVEATLLSLVVALQGFMVFVFAALMKLEHASPKRIFGLAIGLSGIVAMLLQQYEPDGSTKNYWLLAALLLPLFLALESITLADKRPKHIDHIASVGLMFGFSILFVLPLAFLTGDLMPLGADMASQGIVIVLLGLVAALANVTFFILVATAGPVFASQTAYSMTLSGIVWGMLLLGEEMQLIAWAAISLAVIGMYLVEPKPSDEFITIKRNFG